MDATLLLARLESLGVSVKADGDKLRLSPASMVPDDLVETLREHKPAMLDAVAEREPDTLIRRCARLGVTLRLEQHEGLWRFVANPASLLTPALVAALKRHKTEVLAELIRWQICHVPGCGRESYVYLPKGNDDGLPACEIHQMGAE